MRIINTIDVVKLVSIITFLRTSFILKVLQKLQTIPKIKKNTAKVAHKTAVNSDEVLIVFIFKSKFATRIVITIKEIIVTMAGAYFSLPSP